MSLTSLLVANVLSLSNLAHFLDRLITDGKYETVLLIYDEASVEDTNFVPGLANLAAGKYSTVIVDMDRGKIPWMEMKPYHLQFGVLEIVMVNCDRNDVCLNTWLLQAGHIHNRHNIILLIPMQSEDRKSLIWKWFNYVAYYICHVNISVVFYEKEMSLPKDDTSRKSIEIFVLDYQPFRVIGIDVKNIFNQNRFNNDRSNLNDKIFGSITWKPAVFLKTFTADRESVINRTLQSGNSTLINMGRAELYLMNFIARNLRAKNIATRQLLGADMARGIDETFVCNTSNEKYYPELYNIFIGAFRPIKRFVSIVSLELA